MQLQASRRAAERALRLTTVGWSGVWLLGMAGYTLIGNDPILRSPLWFAALTLTTVSWGILGLASRVPANQFAIVLVGTSSVLLLDLDPTAARGPRVIAATWVLVAALAMAMLVQPRPASIAVPAYAGAMLALAVIRLAPSELDSAVDALVVSIHALCVAMAVWVGARALRHAGDVADVEAVRVRERTGAQLAAEAHQREVERLTRLLHDTCINTLGAIRDGAGIRTPDAVRARCAHDLSLMDPLARDVGAPTLPRLPDLAAAIGRDSRMLGVPVEVSVVGDELYPLAPGVWQAASGAVREALVNVTKHASGAQAWVEISSGQSSVTVAISDDGPGWGGAVPTGGGIERSIVDRVRSSGGLARVRSEVDGGTHIHLTWPKTVALAPAPALPATGLPDVGQDGPAVGRLPLAMRRIALGSGGWMLAFCICTAAVTVTRGAPAAPSVMALTALFLCLWFVARFAQSPLPLPETLLLSAGIAVVVALPVSDQGGGGCPQVGPYAWAVQGATAIVMLIVLFGASWWHPTLALAGVALGVSFTLWSSQADNLSCAPAAGITAAIEAGIVIVALGFRRIFTRQWRAADALHEQALRDASSTAQEAARDRARDSRVRTLVAGAGPLLMRIAEGDIDPGAPEVIAAAGEHEAGLRSLLVLNSALGHLGDALAAVLLDAMESGRRLDIRCGEPVPHPTDDQVAVMSAILRAAIDRSAAGDVVAVALFSHPDGGALNVVAPMSRPILDDQVLADAVATNLDVRQLALDDELLVEVEWRIN